MSGNQPLGFAFGFVFDLGDEGEFFFPCVGLVTKESLRLAKVGECQSSLFDGGLDLGKIFEKSHGFNAPLSLIFGVAEFFHRIFEERAAFEITVELAALDLFEVGENLREHATLFAHKFREFLMEFLVCHAVGLAWVFARHFLPRGGLVALAASGPHEAGF